MKVLAIDEGECFVKISEDNDPDVAIVKGSGNVYRDLGFDDAEAMAEKAGVVMKISALLKDEGISKTQACDTLGVPLQLLDDLLKGKFSAVETETLLGYEKRLAGRGSC